MSDAGAKLTAWARTRLAAATLVALAAAAGLPAAGCGGDAQEARAVLSQTADSLAQVRSGHLDMRVLAAPSNTPDRGVGFQLSGPFALDGDEPLPVTRMRYTRLLGERKVSAVLTSTGTEAFITTSDTTTPLDPATAEGLAGGRGRGGAERGRSLSDLGLAVDAWIEDPKLTEGPRLDGAQTDRVAGRLRSGRAVRDVLAALRRAGAEVPAPTAGLVDRLDGAVRSARAEIVTGRSDRRLRRLDLRVALRPARELEGAIPGDGAVTLTARLDLRRIDRRVTVQRPRPR
jgi:hypothetical protein